MGEVTEHVHGEDGWYAYRPLLKGCRCMSCTDDSPELRVLICDSMIEYRDSDDFPYLADCEEEFGVDDLDNFDELWQNARF